MFNLNNQKRELLRWSGWFFAGNIILFWLLGLKYTHSVSWLGTGYLTKHAEIGVIIFLVVSYLGQLALLAFAPFFLVASLILIYPRRQLVMCSAAIIATICAALLISDTDVYRLFHFHVNGIVLNLILNSTHEEFFNFSLIEKITIVSILSGLLLLEFGFAYLLQRLLRQSNFLRGWGKWVAAVLSLVIYTSYSMLAFSANQKYARFYLEAARVLPCYIEMLGAMLPVRDGKIAIERSFERFVVQPAQAAQPLNYPLQALQFAHPKQKLNIVIIGIDTWRFDMLNPAVTPHIYQFAQQAVRFNQHYSGGDATGPGVFSFFYGLPATYWSSMEKQRRSPVLLDELQKQHYQMNILASAGWTLPPFNKTIFPHIKNLKLKLAGSGPYERDVEVTKEFKRFLSSRNSAQSFFSFIFYDSSHSYCNVKNTMTPFQPVAKHCDRLTVGSDTDLTQYFNRYKNALHLVDAEVGKVLDELKAKNLLENTVIIITGDHGEEFNDNHLGYWGHTSNFTRYQIRTPLIIYWPGKSPATIKYATTHFDVAPTLMTDVLGCKTPANQYSIGHSLWTNQPYPYLLEGSYIGYGIVEKDRITNIFPTGNYQITQPNGQLLASASLRPEVMHHAYQEMERFYAGTVN